MDEISILEQQKKIKEIELAEAEEQFRKTLDEYLQARREVYVLLSDEDLRTLMSKRLNDMEAAGDAEYKEFGRVDRKILKNGKREEMIHWLAENDKTHKEEVATGEW
jgi:uncharacterized membrane protein